MTDELKLVAAKAVVVVVVVVTTPPKFERVSWWFVLKTMVSVKICGMMSVTVV